jgi:2-methylcitrate dehydratase PrpD
MAADGKFHDRGFHATPMCGSFAASLVSGKVQGNFSVSQFVNAMGICGSQGGGVQQFLIDGTWVKMLHPGLAAHNGIVASELAFRGFTGPVEVFEGELGFFSAYLGLENCKLECLTEQLGEVWETLRIVIKPYPSCHFTHSFIDCALSLKEKHRIDYRDIRRIVCRISPRGALIVCEPIETRRKVTTSYGGRFSLPYTVALALVEGEVGLKQFSERYLKDDKISKVANLVDYIKDESLASESKHFPGDVTIELENGAHYREVQRFERGSCENPLKAHEVREKFRSNMTAAGVTDESRVGKIIGMIDELEEIENIGELTAILRNCN